MLIVVLYKCLNNNIFHYQISSTTVMVHMTTSCAGKSLPQSSCPTSLQPPACSASLMVYTMDGQVPVHANLHGLAEN